MALTKIKFEDYPSTNTPLSASILNQLQDNIENFVNNELKNKILEIYPIGSIYMSTSSNNPSSFLGGTWVAWGSGKVPVGVNTNDNDFESAELTGGEKQHKLSANELPKLSGSAVFRDINMSDHNLLFSVSGVFSSTYQEWTGNHSSAQSVTASNPKFNQLNLNFGNDEPFNIMQPYITCYMWKRTA